jgi:hypothetical protein
MPLEPHDTAPYRALFIGGVLDGQILSVASLAPTRVAPVSTAVRRSPQRAWDGKSPLVGAHDVYDCDGDQSGAEDYVTYSLVGRR